MTWRVRLDPYRPILDPLLLPLLELYYGDDSMQEHHLVGLMNVLAAKPVGGPFIDAAKKFANSPLGQMLIQMALAYLAKQAGSAGAAEPPAA